MNYQKILNLLKKKLVKILVTRNLFIDDIEMNKISLYLKSHYNSFLTNGTDLQSVIEKVKNNILPSYKFINSSTGEESLEYPSKLLIQELIDMFDSNGKRIFKIIIIY